MTAIDARACRGAHPRSRGENTIAGVNSTDGQGSSPLTRGKLRYRAGGRNPVVAHPRSRGENWPTSGMTVAGQGSSPLTRGKHSATRSRAEPGGLIPAHAGKTNDRLERAAHPGAHPRSRGENVPLSLDHPNLTGSSPLTRGKRAYSADGSAFRGLIPAHAGKTTSRCDSTGIAGAHPRSRGENCCGGFAGWDGGGSSPLTRGKLGIPGKDLTSPRLIPAHAGKTIGRPNHEYR